MKKSVETIIAATEVAYQEGDMAKTISLCRKALKTDSQNIMALTLLGNAYFLERQYEKAQDCYLHIKTLQPDSLANLINLANVCFELKSYDESCNYGNKALMEDKNNLTALSLLGNAYLESEKYPEAIRVLEKLTELSPHDFWVDNSLSQAWQKQGDFRKAFSYALSAVEKSGGDSSQQLNLSYLLYETALEKGADFISDEVAIWEEKYGQDSQVRFVIDSLKNNSAVRVANPEYLHTVFDNFAADFEQVLSGLDYRAPQYIAQYMEQLYPHTWLTKIRILDAGCGTGLCGLFLKKYAKYHGLDGVDLSEKMIAEAKKKLIYHRLYCQELCAFLRSQNNAYDLITAADVLTYFGDLKPVFANAFSALKKRGRIIFTITKNNENDSDWHLHMSGRFSHTLEYVETLLNEHGFRIEKTDVKPLRTEAGKSVMGYIISARK